MLSAVIQSGVCFVHLRANRNDERGVSTSSYRYFWQWITPGLLSAFINLLLQPQVDALYHVHRGGEHPHVHARLLVSPTAQHHHHHVAHTHNHHQHTDATSARHVHHHTAPHSRGQTTPVLRHSHHHAHGHWHSSIALHWAGQIAKSPILAELLAQPLQEKTPTVILHPPFFTARSRAPPFSF